MKGRHGRGSRKRRSNELRLAYAVNNSINNINGFKNRDIESMRSILFGGTGKSMRKKKSSILEKNENTQVQKTDNKESNLVTEDVTPPKEINDCDTVCEEKTDSTEEDFTNYDFVANEKRPEKDSSQRVKRGMVFWYNIDPYQNKYDDHSFNVYGKRYHDYVIYGKRPWLVISNDTLNKYNQLVTVVPLSTSQSGRNYENHVEISISGRDTAVLCEQMRSVNSLELREYFTTLDDDTMSKVENAIMYQLGMSKNEYSISSNMKDIESMIDSIIKSKAEEMFKKESNKQVHSVIERLKSELKKYTNNNPENSIENGKEKGKDRAVKQEKESKKEEPEKRKSVSAIEKFYSKYPQLKERTVVGASDKDDKEIPHKKNGKWDKDSANRFFRDLSTSDVEDVMKKWNLSSKKACTNTKIYLRKKFPEIAVNQ